MKWLDNLKRYFYAKKYEEIEDLRGKTYGKLFSTLFELGYFAGALKNDPEKAWEEACKALGSKIPISEKLLAYKGGKADEKTSG